MGDRRRAIRRAAAPGRSPSTARGRPAPARRRRARCGSRFQTVRPRPARRSPRRGRRATRWRASRAEGGSRPSSACSRGSGRRGATAPQSPERIRAEPSSRRRCAAPSDRWSSASYRTPVYRSIAGSVGGDAGGAVRLGGGRERGALHAEELPARGLAPSHRARERVEHLLAAVVEVEGHRAGGPRRSVAARRLALGRGQQDQGQRGSHATTEGRRRRRGGTARSRSRARRPKGSRPRAAVPRGG